MTPPGMTPPGNFSWVETDRLAASAYPYTLANLQWLRNEGIDLIITLTEDELDKGLLNQTGLLNVHIPIPDMTAPSLDQLVLSNQMIQKANSAGMKVNVHCLYGQGRTGTVLAAYLIGLGFPLEEAIQRIRQQRPGSIETANQELRLRQFASHIAASKSNQ